jgi:hypothetical protein
LRWTYSPGRMRTLHSAGSRRVTPRTLATAAYVHACEASQHFRGKRKKYLRRAWKIAHHLPHWPDGPLKATALAMLIMLLLAAARAKPKGAV